MPQRLGSFMVVIIIILLFIYSNAFLCGVLASVKIGGQSCFICLICWYKNWKTLHYRSTSSSVSNIPVSCFQHIFWSSRTFRRKKYSEWYKLFKSSKVFHVSIVDINAWLRDMLFFRGLVNKHLLDYVCFILSPWYEKNHIQ